ncbi:hypothetical protein CAP51_03470 [Acinetobacter populi]|uniref:TonB-dependent receptor n=2 Tax=Acinetobacter populi TaxID=1582270 RepID=A0A1Z9Z2J8_9GAMM|nr:hypothetical protein CAP51_03470 [Acinetobacter populi]
MNTRSTDNLIFCHDFCYDHLGVCIMILSKTKLSVAVSMLLSFAVQNSHADTQPDTASTTTSPAVETQSTEQVKQLETIVVTGTARSSGISKLDAGFSISTVNQEQIQEVAPQSTADLMKIVPGVFAETSGGVAGLHVGVRGFPQNGGGGFATVQLDGSPIFVPATLDFLEGFSLFRIDDTVERVEVLRGGPSPIFSNGNPGLTVNFIQKKGKDTPEGTAGITLGSEGLYRFDGYYGGKIAEGWYATVGGFYRQSDGIRDTQYPADEGGQLSATLSKRWGDGNDLTFYVRKTHDSNAFFTPAPLLSNNGKLSTYPGFDQRKDTLQGNDLRQLNLEIAPNQTISRDYSDGRTIDLNLFGANLDLNFDEWTLSNRASFLKGTADVRALFTSATPLSLNDYINGRITAVNGSANVVNSAGGSATSGSASFASTGSAITDLSRPVIVAALNSIDKDIESFSNDFRLSRSFADHTVTLGGYFAHYSVDDLWYQGNNVLLSMEPNARRINVTLDNGVQISRDGFVSATTNQVKASYSGSNYAAFLADEWQITPDLRLDAGIRLEHYKADGNRNLTTAGVDLDGNPLTFYNNSSVILNGDKLYSKFSDTKTSWTVGANYFLQPDLSVFARLNSGYRFPSLDDVRNLGEASVVQSIDQYELGLKTINSLYDLALTAFLNEFDGQTYTQQIVDPNTNQQTTINSIAGSRTYGLELEAALRPTDRLELRLNTTWLNGEFKDVVDSSNPAFKNGNEVQRQPSVQVRFTPSYYIPLNFADLSLYGTYSYLGSRYSDINNLQSLPSYQTVDLGAKLDFGQWDLRFTGSNITNELGLTEGNPRVAGSANVNNVVMGRSLFGREYQLALRYRF